MYMYIFKIIMVAGISLFRILKIYISPILNIKCFVLKNEILSVRIKLANFTRDFFISRNSSVTKIVLLYKEVPASFPSYFNP